MNNNLVLLLAGLAGSLLGMFFFFGLWWTVRKGIASKHPALWFFGSLLLRTVLVLVGFYLISDGRWERLLVCLLGFIIARFIVIFLVRSRPRPQTSTRQAKPPAESPVYPTEEAKHAS